MPYKEFVPRDTLEEALSKLWGAAQEFIPTTRLEEIICMIANAQPTGIHAVPDIGESDTGKVLTASEDGAVWASGGGGESPFVYATITWVEDTGTLSKTWQEIHDALAAGKIVVVKESGEGYAYNNLICGCDEEDGVFYTNFVNMGSLPNPETVSYTTDSANGYPSITD